MDLTSLTAIGALCLVGPAWYYAGKCAQAIRLPLITGYIVVGVLTGPQVLNILTDKLLLGLTVVDHACLSVIALAAGAELSVGELHKLRKQVTGITLAISVFTWVSVFAAIWFLAPYIPLTKNMSPRQIEGIASLAATLMIARSPASAMAVIKETEGKGPYCTLVMAVVVVKDVLVFVLFALNVEATSMLMKKAEGIDLPHALEPLLTLLLSVLLGLLGSFALVVVLGTRGSSYRPLQSLNRLRFKTVFMFMLTTVVFELAHSLKAEPLLACVIMGLVTTNTRSKQQRVKDAQTEMVHSIHELLPQTNVAFFGLAGAQIKLGALFKNLWIAVVIYVVRLAAVYGGSWSGCWLTGSSAEIRRKFWLGMITQAGVALGLGKAVAARFDGWGSDFHSLMVAVIVMNLFTGPPLFKAAVVSMGEGGSAVGVSDGDLDRARLDPA